MSTSLIQKICVAGNAFFVAYRQFIGGGGVTNSPQHHYGPEAVRE